MADGDTAEAELEEIRCGNRVFSGSSAPALHEHPINKDLIEHFKSKGDSVSWGIAESIEKYEEETKKKVSRGTDIASLYDQETERELAKEVEIRIEAVLSEIRAAKSCTATVSYDRYNQVKQILLGHMRQCERDGQKDGILQKDLISWYIHNVVVPSGVSDPSQFLSKYKEVRSIISHLIEKEARLVVVQEAQNAPMLAEDGAEMDPVQVASRKRRREIEERVLAINQNYDVLITAGMSQGADEKETKSKPRGSLFAMMSPGADENKSKPDNTTIQKALKLAMHRL